jgi:adenosylhomocysteine nucleosidase
MGHAGVVAVTSIALEARIAHGPGVSVVLCSQAAHLVDKLKAAIAHGASGIISFGIAGGLAPHLAAGDCIVASAVKYGNEVLATDRAWAQRLLRAIPKAIHAEVVGSDVLVATPAHKAQLHAETGAIVVDMESHIAARVALDHGIPFAVCRTVIDAAHRTLPPAAAVGLRPDGTPDLRAVIRSLLRYPTQLPDLIRTARDAEVAESALFRARQHLGAGLGIADADGDAEIEGAAAFAVA